MLSEHSSIGITFTANSIHTRIIITQNGKTVLDEYHAGATTKLGQNTTLAKLTGDGTFYNLTTYLLNLTYVSIGNKGTLDSDSVVLPGEWNRTSGSIHDQAYNQFNITAVFHPDTGGPYTADCLGVNYEDGIGNNALWGYDTFNEVTGIDDTFTITLEIIITVA